MELAELRGDVELFELLLMNNALGFSKEDIFHHASRARLSIAPLEHLLATDFEFVASQPLHFALSSLVRKGSAQAVRSILPLFLQSSLHPQRVLENMHRQALESGNIEVAALLQSHLF